MVTLSSFSVLFCIQSQHSLMLLITTNGKLIKNGFALFCKQNSQEFSAIKSLKLILKSSVNCMDFLTRFSFTDILVRFDYYTISQCLDDCYTWVYCKLYKFWLGKQETVINRRKKNVQVLSIWGDKNTISCEIKDFFYVEYFLHVRLLTAFWLLNS